VTRVIFYVLIMARGGPEWVGAVFYFLKMARKGSE